MLPKEIIENLEYPTNCELLLSKKKSIKRELLSIGEKRIQKRIAILGGSTTSDIKNILELFLLKNGIEPEFYESEYNKYFEDVMFDNSKLKEFKPDIIYIHTSYRNVSDFPHIVDSKEITEEKLHNQYSKFERMWDKIYTDYNCTIIQNNFEMLPYRLLGNRDSSDYHGKINFISKLNLMLYAYAQTHKNFYINDINYLSASYGLEKWHDMSSWYLYKYICCINAIPLIAFNISKIIKAIYGKNKKAFVMDLDNTMWGGIVGDDGVENLEIGQETASAEAFSEFQEYIKSHKDLGILLNINSKNDYENAIAGLNHPDSKVSPDDFICIKANWQNKAQNISEIAQELNLGADSFVFVDDNPAEREMVSRQIDGITLPELTNVENYIQLIDKYGYFENISLSEDDMNRNEMYKANHQRVKQQEIFVDYDEYLCSLEMEAEIRPFEDIYLQRIAQLTNKSNQFNLTTKRYSQNDIENIAKDKKYIHLYGKLKDKFGDNGLVSVIIGKKENDILNIELWLMSCRVLKRGMEDAMLDALVKESKNQGIKKLNGYYFKTAKNNMVKDFYKTFGFTKIDEQGEDTTWELDITTYKNKNNIIKMEAAEITYE